MAAAYVFEAVSKTLGQLSGNSGILADGPERIDEERWFSAEEVASHCHPDSCWVILGGKVYNVTRWLQQHPGGEDIILEYAGCDVTASFQDMGHSKDAELLLESLFIGHLKAA